MSHEVGRDPRFLFTNMGNFETKIEGLECHKFTAYFQDLSDFGLVIVLPSSVPYNIGAYARASLVEFIGKFLDLR